MPAWLLTRISRWASGERVRKATSEHYRWYYGLFFLCELFMFVLLAFGKQLVGRSGVVALWLGTIVLVCVLLGGTILWSRWVPARISLALAVITCGVLLWIGLRPAHIW